MLKYLFSALTVASVLSAGEARAEDFSVTSPDVTAGAAISAAQYWNNFGCTGANERPALNWTGAPEGTKSFAVTLYDQDAPTGSGFWHWVIYDIPANMSGVDAASDPEGAVEGKTDLGAPGFFGPCPPIGRKHTYTYTVHALDIAKLDVPENATAALTGFFLYQHTLATAKLPVIAGPRSE